MGFPLNALPKGRAMYRVLLIEEDSRFRDEIVALIDWEQHGFEVLGAVANGIVGRALLERQKPDIVIVSMSARYLGGKSFIEYIAGNGLGVGLIQLYTKHGELLSGQEYPLNIHSLCRTGLTKKTLLGALKLTAAAASQGRDEQAPCPLQQAPHVQRNNAVLHILSGVGSDAYGELDERFGFHFDKGYTATIFVYPSSGERRDFKERLRQQIGNIIRAVLSQNDGGEVFIGENREMGVIACFAAAEDHYAAGLFFTVLASRICEAIKSQIGIDVDCVVSDEARDLQGLIRECQAARQLSVYRYFALNAKVISRRHVVDHSVRVEFREIDACIHKLMRAMTRLREEELAPIVAHLYLTLLKSSMDFSVVQYARLCLDKLNHSYLDEFSIASKTDELLPALEQCATVELECFYIKTHFASLIQSALGKKENLNPVVRLATAYLANHFAEDLTLEIAAKAVNVSHVYLSKLFRREMGMTFTDYLTALRMEQAKRILAIDSGRIADVAQSVGYRDQKYFGRVFKRLTGTSPSAYLHKLHSVEKMP